MSKLYKQRHRCKAEYGKMANLSFFHSMLNLQSFHLVTQIGNLQCPVILVVVCKVCTTDLNLNRGSGRRSFLGHHRSCALVNWDGCAVRTYGCAKLKDM